MTKVWRWSHDGFAVSAELRGSSLDVRITSRALPSPVWLQIGSGVFGGLRINDLTGTGYDTGFQGRGYGTLAVNTAIQVLRASFRADEKVEGYLSTEGDPPPETSAGQRCSARRKQFWSEFGFEVHPTGGYGHGEIRATLSQLTPNEREKLVEERIPRFIKLSEFKYSEEPK